MERSEEPDPALRLVLEIVAGAMGLRSGRQRLEVVFVDGHLERWWSHAENRPVAALSDFEPQGSRAMAASIAKTLLERARSS